MMADLSFVVITVLLAAASIVGGCKRRMGWSNITPLVVAVGITIVVTYPVVVVHVLDDKVSFYLGIVALSTAPLMVLGAKLWASTIQYPTVSKPARRDRDSSRAAGSLRIVGIATALVLLIITAVTYYRGLPPLFEAIWFMVRGLGDITALAGEMRRIVNKAYILEGKEYQLTGSFEFIYPWVAILLGIWCFLERRHAFRRGRRLLYDGILILCACLLFGSFERGPVGWYFAGLFMVGSVSYFRVGRFMATFVAVFAAVLVLLTFVQGRSRVRYDEQGVFQVTTDRLVNRILFTNGRNSLVLMDEYSDRLGIGYGREHLRQVKAVLPGNPPIPLAYYLWQWREGDENRRATFATPTYLGIVFSDFRLPGVVVIYTLLGAFLKFVSRIGERYIWAYRGQLRAAGWGCVWVASTQIVMRGIVSFAVDLLVIGGIMGIVMLVQRVVGRSVSRVANNGRRLHQ